MLRFTVSSRLFVLSRRAVYALAMVSFVLTLCIFDLPTKGLAFRNPSQPQLQAGTGIPDSAVILTTATAPGNAQVMYVGTVKHGVFRSVDGGQSFQAVNRGLPPAIGTAPVTPIEHLAVDPRTAEIAYVATEVDGIYKTTDGGHTWRAVNNGLPGRFQYRTYQPLLAIDSSRPNTVYAVIGYPVHSHLVRNRVYKSTDGGRHWYAIHNLRDNQVYHSLTLVAGEVVVASGTDEIRFKDTGQRVEEFVPPPPLSAAPTNNIDVGDIAVIEDDGTMIRNFDLSNRSLEFAPATSPGYQIVEVPATFETDIGEQVMLADEASAPATLPFPFPFYGFMPASLFVNANGHLTFNTSDPTGGPSATLNFSQFRLGPPRIAALWTNLNPGAGGGVFIKTAADPARVIVTWNRVPQSEVPDANTFQIVLFSDGRIRFNYGRVAAAGGLVGLSPGRSLNPPTTVNLSRDLPQTVDNRAVLEFFTGDGIDIQAVAKKFYETHADLHDQLIMFGASEFRSPLAMGPFVVAFHRLIRNDVRGIGLPVGGLGGGPTAFGSAGRLQGILNANTLAIYPDDFNQDIGGTFTPLDVLTHEAAHRWMVYLIFERDGRPSIDLLRLDFSHWSFFVDTDASVMFGNRWQDNGDGTFTTVAATEGYGPIDLYLMGLRPPADTEPFFYVSSPSGNSAVNRDNLPQAGVTVSGNRVDVSLDQITSLNGPRQPAFGSSPTSFNQAFILVVPERQTAAPQDVTKLERLRLAYEQQFNRITGRRAVANTRLNPGRADLMIRDVTLNPPVVSPGGAVSLSFTVSNQGTAPAGLALHDVRLSGNETVDASDSLAKKLTTTSLAPGESATFNNVPVTIPINASSGSQFIIVTIDAGGTTPETDKANNHIATPVTVLDGGVSLTPFAETEDNDQAGRATRITPDAVVTGVLSPARDVDFYSLTAAAGQTLTIDINAQSLSPSSPANTVLTLFDNGGQTLAQNDDFAGSLDSFVQFVIPRSGQYVFRVQHAANQQGGPAFVYQAIVLLRSITTTAESEPNSSFAQANAIRPDAVVGGVLDPAGDEDFFVLSAGTGQLLRVDVAAHALNPSSLADTVVSVFDANGGLIAENDDFGGSTDSAIQTTIPKAGQYFIRIRDLAGRGGPGFRYRATIKLTNVQAVER
jgi:hypothetical protein